MNARTRLTVAAGAVIVALTAAAFWLSYAHLHDVAATYGLGVSPARAWAWPATLDLFIVAGEIMMLVAALNKRRDPWAICLTVAGSVGSIALNVLGVGRGAEVLEYVVAAVPPAAALLAFGALMRQLHTAVATPATAPTLDAMDQAVDQAVEYIAAETEVAVTASQEVQEVPAETAPLADVVEELESLEDAVEVQEEVPEPQVTEVHRITAKPTVQDIAAAVADIQSEGSELTGKALAAYFGVSDRSGRRYLNDWAAATSTSAA
ncbi:DUF2637 domain-containing protein [Streptomyces sp. NPDC007025]|uniref:DUF2637 domain-containing protein n=1 Tax=Streptomyces sp. NPDC007025 TaxID=3364771 RepID=UPI0036CA1159